MRSIRRALRLIVATGALLPFLASAPAEATILDCAGYTDSTHPTYVNVHQNYHWSTVEACVGIGANLAPAGEVYPIVGVFLDLSATQYPTFTTMGVKHTLSLSGGVCVTFHAPFMMSECLHDPSFTVNAGPNPWGGPYDPQDPSYYVVPCIDDTTPSGYPSLFGYGVGAACLKANLDVSGSIGWYPAPSQLGLTPGVCLQKAGTFTCFVLYSETTVNGAATSQKLAVCEGATGSQPNCTNLL